MSCKPTDQPTLFTVPPYINVTNPPPGTLGDPGDILIREDGPIGSEDYFTWLPSENIFRFRGTVGAEVNTGQVLRLNADGLLIPYASLPFPPIAPAAVGIAITSAVSGEVYALREGVHEGDWPFAPNARLWVGEDSYPTPIQPTWGVILECGYGLRNGYIRYESEPPILGA